MISLTTKTGHKITVDKGTVRLEGNCITLYETGKNLEHSLVYAFCLQPGDTVTREGDNYLVQF